MKKLFVIGNRTSKSLSPDIFNYWFKKYNINAHYGFLETSNKKFDKLIKEKLSDKNTIGLNITIPFKKSIIKYADILDRHSKTINAVNCISIKNKIKAINTDWIGYYKTLPKKINLKNKKIILIGYGGAALAIHYVLKRKGFKNIMIFNRTKKALKFDNNIKYTKNMNKLVNHIGSADMIINTTPTNPISAKNRSLIGQDTILSDIVYKPKQTSFLKRYPKNKKIYGITMLLEQAIPCFNLWFGFKPTIDDRLIKMLEKKIK
tara:strand:+ start:759 stop:1544 length:786 start_codon:yes stop_codon:yes gene_type:complete